MKEQRIIKKALFIFLLGIISFVQNSIAQQNDEGVEEIKKVSRVFKSFDNTKVVNLQSLETIGEGIMELRFSHKFGKITGGLYDLFGLDNATMRFALDFGINDRLQIGVGRSTYEKTWDAHAKYRVLWQTRDDESVPLSLVLYSSTSLNTLRYTGLPYDYSLDMRLNYIHQMIVGRQFSKRLSIEMVPTIVHRNFVQANTEKNTIFALGTAGRFRLNESLAITSEYIFVPEGQLNPVMKNSLSLGLDINTMGHVFQLHFTNSQLMVDKGFIGETTGNWLNGDIYFGFNIMREFSFSN